MPEKKSRKIQIAWWPLLVPRPNEVWVDEFFMSIALLVATYSFAGFSIFGGFRYIGLIVILLYFSLIWLQIVVSDHLTIAEKLLAFFLQTSLALVFVAPLISMFRSN